MSKQFTVSMFANKEDIYTKIRQNIGKQSQETP
jgi:hypothetical protein